MLTPVSSSRRNKSIDYLRGIMATGVMYYHYSIFVSHDLNSDSIVSRLGVYCVAIFYILSGLTLYLVYKDALTLSSKSLVDFAVKRIFRIYPLLWLVMIGSILVYHTPLNYKVFIMNFSGLFGFINLLALYSPVQWSIGNELVFYSLFPIIMYLINRLPKLYYIFTIITMVIGGYFAFGLLDSHIQFRTQWRTYINPLNQVMLFNFGILIGIAAAIYDREKYKAITYLMLLAGLVCLLFYPTTGQKIDLVTGINRFVFSAACLMVCFGTYFQTFQIPNYLDKVFSFLGESSYSIYLLHPLIWAIVTKFNLPSLENSQLAKTSLCILLTLICSYLVFQYFETYFINLGRRLLKKFGKQI